MYKDCIYRALEIILRQGNVTRAEIARTLGISATTAGQLAARLSGCGMIQTTPDNRLQISGDLCHRVLIPDGDHAHILSLSADGRVQNIRHEAWNPTVFPEEQLRRIAADGNRQGEFSILLCGAEEKEHAGIRQRLFLSPAFPAERQSRLTESRLGRQYPEENLLWLCTKGTASALLISHRHAWDGVFPALTRTSAPGEELYPAFAAQTAALLGLLAIDRIVLEGDNVSAFRMLLQEEVRKSGAVCPPIEEVPAQTSPALQELAERLTLTTARRILER